MTCILKKDQTITDEYYYFDDHDELYQWVDDNISKDERKDWVMLDDEGGIFYV